MNRFFMRVRRWSVTLAIPGAMVCMAQKAPELDYLIRFADPVNGYQEKRIYEVLQGHEPGVILSVDRPGGLAKVRTHIPLVRTDLEASWNGDGLVILQFSPNPSYQGSERSLAIDPFPQFHDTGDPDADHAHYAAAKAAWIAAHPGEYERMWGQERLQNEEEH